MNFITSFITSFCAACVLIGSLYIICPEGNLAKPIKYLLSLLFIVIVIACTSIGKNIKFDFPNPEIQQSSTEELQIYSAEYVFSYVLKQNEINFDSITVCTDNSPDGSIVISKVTIYTDCEKDKVINALGELATTREVEIINDQSIQ